jgi:hypothetical protein
VVLSKDGIVVSEDYNVTVNRTTPKLDESKALLLHVIKQAVDDYQIFKNKTREDHKEIWESARRFIFDDDYYIDWGDVQLNLEQICELIHLEVEWVRNKISQQLEVKLKDGVISVERNK